MDEYQLKTYYANLEIDYDNITFLTKEFYCLNKTIDYIFLSNKEFFLITENSKLKSFKNKHSKTLGLFPR
jgi:hypothetical protein